MKVYDAIIVGAGPAGASAAVKASELGLETLLIDKRSEIGVPVQCGEYMPHETEVNRMFSDSEHVSNLIELSKETKQNECNFVRIITPSGSEYNLRFHAYVIDRARFDKKLVSRAERNGCEIKLNTVALAVDTDKSKLSFGKQGKRESASFKVLIAADGFNSDIARSLGLKTTSHENEAITIQNLMEEVDIETNICEMFFNRDYSPGGYSWIIPKRANLANVGLGIRGKFTKGKRSLNSYLSNFLSKNSMAFKKFEKGHVLSSVGGVVPVGGPIPKTFYKNVLIAGDAAGQVAAHVGGGVPSSIICGELAGETAYLYIEKEMLISEYEKSWKKEIGKALKRSIMLRKIGDLFINTNRSIDLILSLIGEKGLNRLIRCEMPINFESLLTKN